MEMRGFACPNCGANIDIMDSRTIYCEYCGSKVYKEKNSFRELYDKAVLEFSIHDFSFCRKTIHDALVLRPRNADLLFMKAMITQDMKILNIVNKADISKEVLGICKKEFDQWKIDIHYWIPWNIVKYKTASKVDQVEIQGKKIHENETIQRAFVFCEYFMSDSEAETYKDKISKINDAKYLELVDSFTEWKRKYKRAFYNGYISTAITMLSALFIIISKYAYVFTVSGMFFLTFFYLRAAYLVEQKIRGG